jgi:hypothetical protein
MQGFPVRFFSPSFVLIANASKYNVCDANYLEKGGERRDTDGRCESGSQPLSPIDYRFGRYQKLHPSSYCLRHLDGESAARLRAVIPIGLLRTFLFLFIFSKHRPAVSHKTPRQPAGIRLREGGLQVAAIPR